MASISIKFDGKTVSDGDNQHNVIEVGVKKELTLDYGTFPWGNESLISFVCPGNVTLFYTDPKDNDKEKTYERTLYKENIGSLFFVANKASEAWDDEIIVTVSLDTGSGSGSHSETSSVELTAYDITMEVQERPWGEKEDIFNSKWIEVEDKGDYESVGKTRPWFHLWQENINAIRADVKPKCLAELAEKKNACRFDRPKTLATDSFTLNLEGYTPGPPDVLARPPWRKITAGIGHYIGTMASVTVGDVTLDGTQNKVDIVVNKIKEMGWVRCIAYTGYIDPEDGSIDTYHHDQPWEKAHVAKLEEVTVSYEEVYRVFPEMTHHSSEFYDTAEFRVDLESEVPYGMQATVHVARFDPDNPIDTSWLLMPTYPRDNEGDIEIQDGDTMTLESPAEGFASRRKRIKFKKENPHPHAGDNYIIAAHPNAGVVERYRFGASQSGLLGSVLKINSATSEYVPDSLQTPVLTVWRTLWVERDVAEWEGMPPGDLRAPIDDFVKTELERACVEIKDWPYNHSPMADKVSPVATYAEFNKIKFDEGIKSGDKRDLIKSNNTHFWTVRIVTIPSMTYKARGITPEELKKIGAKLSDAYPRRGLFAWRDNTIFLLYEYIVKNENDAVYKGYTETRNPRIDYTDRENVILPLMRVTTLHEIAHLLIGGGEIDNTGGAMTGASDSARLKPEWQRLTDDHIRKLQKLTKAQAIEE